MKTGLTPIKIKRFKETAEELLQLARAVQREQRAADVQARRLQRTNAQHDRLREVLYRRTEGAKYTEIAAELGVTPGRARELVARAVRCFAGWRKPYPLTQPQP